MKVSFTMCMALPIVVVAGGPSVEQISLYKARVHGALAKECLRVVDQDGQPVAGAAIRGGCKQGGAGMIILSLVV